MNLIIVALVVAWATFYILAPLRRSSAAARDIEYSMSETVGAERAQNALALAELDLSLGRIHDDEYRELQTRHAPPISNREAQEKTKNQTVVSSNQSQLKNESESESDAALEAEILIARARRKRETPPQSATNEDWMCAQCQRTMSAQDRFCASCGASRVAQKIAV